MKSSKPGSGQWPLCFLDGQIASDDPFFEGGEIKIGYSAGRKNFTESYRMIEDSWNECRGGKLGRFVGARYSRPLSLGR